MDNPITKAEAFEAVCAFVTRQGDDAKEAMMGAQAEANQQKGTMGDKYESFREQMQIERDRHAERYDKALQSLEVLRRIDISVSKSTVSLGALVSTDQRVYFIGAGAGVIKMPDGRSFVALSTATPLFLAMAGLRPGDTFSFPDKRQVIRSIQ